MLEGVLVRAGGRHRVLVLPGFVIAYSQDRARDRRFSTYFLKRFLRIYVVGIPVFFLSGALSYMHDGDFGTVREWIGNVLMLQDSAGLKLGVVIPPPLFHNSPLWSLSYEWWFYVLFFPLNRIRPALATWLVSGGMAAAAVAYVLDPGFLSRLIMYLGTWWIGLEMTRSYVRAPSACLT